MNPRRTTLHDVAKVLGVSHTTVALALKGHHRISIARRKQVKRMAEKMGYTPDPFLSGLAAYRKKHGSVRFQGLIAWVNHWEQPAQLRKFREFDAYWCGASEAARLAGYQLEETRWEAGCSPKRFERVLLTRGVQGVLVPPHHILLDWENFDWNKFSVIRFGQSVQNPDTNLVSADHFRAVVMAIKKIHKYGCQRIGFTVNEEFNQRLGGNYLGGYFYAQTLLKLKMPLPPLLTFLKIRNADEVTRQKAALQKWLVRHKPDAVLTADMEVPIMMRELGYRIPQDIAVAGTSVLDLPGIDAGIDQHPEAIGRIAVEMLVKQINVSERGEPADPCRILVESRWQDGKSLPRRRL